MKLRAYNTQASFTSLVVNVAILLSITSGVSRKSFGSTPSTPPSIQIFAYNADGTNAGIGRLTQHMKVGVAIKGASDQSVTWTLQGSGTLSGGIYQAPATMPSNPSVTISASLTATPSVTASYTFTLVNPIPVIYNATGTLNRAATNPVTISGDGIVPGTTVLVNGIAVQSVYQSSGSLLAQVPVPANGTGSGAITLQNGAPVGGTSTAFPLSIAPATVQVFAYSADGTNAGIGRLTQHMKLGASLKGTADQNVNWSLQGAGSISGATYQAPASMPANPSVTVTASLAAMPSVSSSYTFTLVNPVPVIYSVAGTLNRAATNSIAISGDGIVPGTVVLVSGVAVQSTYQSSGSVLAQVPVSANASGTLPVSLQNGSPVGGASAAFPVAVAAASVQIYAYNADGTNTGTGRLTQHMTLGATVKGATSQSVTWILQGAGSLSGATYQAPSTMPANASVTITATSVAVPSVSSSYTFNLVNPVPVIYKVAGTLNRASTNPVTITGDGFVPGTMVIVNGTVVASTYQASGSLIAQIPVGSNASGTLPVTLQNGSPMGGTSAAFQVPVAAATIQVFAYNADGTNTGTARLTQHLTLGTGIKGTADQNVTWSLQGAGSISGTMYQAPSTMPTNPSVTITAALSATPSISNSYTFTLVNPVPTIYKLIGTLNTAATNAVNITGDGFIPGTVVTVNGIVVPSTYQSSGNLLVQIPVPAKASGNLPVILQNPAPAGGSSAVFQAPIAVANDPAERFQR